MHAATPAPDGKPARHGATAWALTVGFLVMWTLAGLGAYMFVVAAFLR